MSDQPRYSERQALAEAEQMKEAMKTGAAKTYSEAAAHVELEGQRHYRENIERHSEAIGEYLQSGYLDNIPAEYRGEYRQMVETQFAELERTPIDPQCKFSLVLPAFNEERVIQKTLESLQHQEGVAPQDFEVILVINYEAGRPPMVNDYDEQGQPAGQHPDRTREIAEKIAASSPIRVHIIEQPFPADVKGVGIASKLGMDLALKRQEHNPQVVGYYGADTIFEPHWIRGVLDGYQQENIDGVRGVAKSAPVDRRVEDERGLHILTETQRDEVVDLSNREWEYSQRLYKLEDVFHKKEPGKSRQITGLPTQTAGMYARIGGMKGFRRNVKQQLERRISGEDWNIAQEVADHGQIYWNERMQARALGRIEPPRTDMSSYTGSLWSMYRAYMYGEGEVLNGGKDLMVGDPERALKKEELSNEMKLLFSAPDMEVPTPIITTLLEPGEQTIIRQLIKKHAGDWDEFIASVPSHLGETIIQRLNEKYPKIPIDEAEKKIERVKQSLG